MPTWTVPKQLQLECPERAALIIVQFIAVRLSLYMRTALAIQLSTQLDQVQPHVPFLFRLMRTSGQWGALGSFHKYATQR